MLWTKILSVTIATLIAMSFAAVVFAAEDDKPIVIAGPNAAIPVNEINKQIITENAAEKAAKAKTKADAEYATTKAKEDAKKSKAKSKADAKAAKEKN
jgi:hypothetical protein